MSIVHELLGSIQLPKMALVRQIFPSNSVDDVGAAVKAEFDKPEISGAIKSGAKIAITVGSRGLNRLPELVSAIVDNVKARGAIPFVVPSMGSHGGATAKGQLDLLVALGVTEKSVGCEIRSSMETIELGQLENGLPVYMDKHAAEADGIIVVNRIKPHTSYSGDYESGLVKMLSIGLGNQKGADSCHTYGFGLMSDNIRDMAEIKLQKTPVILGIATIENAYDRITEIIALPANTIMAAEPELLKKAKSLMPRLMFNPLDVLIVDQMGKEFSGTGVDPNITGKVGTPFIQVSQHVENMAVLNITEKSHGNANGIGLADSCTRRLVDKIDFEATYANPLTSTIMQSAKIPMTLDNDLMAIQACIKTCKARDLSKLRIVRIANTLDIGNILISEALLDEAKDNPKTEVIGSLQYMEFDVDGGIAELGSFQHLKAN